LIVELLAGDSDKNIRFQDLCKVMIRFGFKERIRGSHHIYSKPDVQEIINLQEGGNGKAKPYQVRQVREILVRYKLVKSTKE
jgi:hypothetical protein